MISRTQLSRLARLFGRARSPGYVDHFDAGRIAGWAYDRQDPTTPALLSLYVDGAPELNIVADMAREDVQAAGLGPLRCGFDATLPRKLRDGQAHRVELRLGLHGPVLRGGTLRIPATAAAEPGMAAAADPAPLVHLGAGPEGVAFFDPRSGAVTGWAVGCSRVLVAFDGGAPQPVLLDREVPGFGSGSRQGFRLRIPQALRDGAPHRAEVTFDGSGAPLDGTPLRFALAPDRPFVELDSVEPGEIVLRLRDAAGRPMETEIVLHGDGAVLPLRWQGGRAHAALPAGLRQILIATPQGMPLARFALAGGAAQDLALRELPEGALAAPGLEAARTAFARFCAEPDSRFDPLWYRWSSPDTWHLEDPAQLLEHYRQSGAAAGRSPGPLFDEAEARRLYPALAPALAAGTLPCAFALDLALGGGRLEPLPGLTPPLARLFARSETAGPQDPDAEAPRDLLDDMLRRQPGPEPLSAVLPPPLAAQDPVTSIYAAWLARLDMPPETRAALDRDEQGLRREIAGSALTRRPLVSIIMPSWNRAFTIGEAIQSVLDQSYPDWELIICDDASEDRTAEVVRSFDDRRIRYMKFLKSNGAGARNKGLRQARGEIIAYLDSDNMWHPLFLDLMLRRLLAAPGSAIAYAAYLDTEISGARVHLHGVSRPPFRPVRLSSKNFMDLNSIVHHRRLYDWLGGFDGALPRLQDWDLALRYTSIFRPLFVDHAVVYYRRNVAWGQVTHLHMNSGAQGTVADKTRRRLEERHERLDIRWPARGRITVLCGGPEQQPATAADRAMAEALARLAAPVAEVDLVLLGEDPAAAEPRAGDPAGLRRHVLPLALQRDPLRAGSALYGLLQGRPVLSAGPQDSYLRAMAGLHPAEIWPLRGGSVGSLLQNLADPQISFDLGALPLDLPAGPQEGAELTLLVLPPRGGSSAARADLRGQIAAEAARRGMKVLLPPREGAGWRRSERSGWQDLAPDPVTGLPAELGRCAMTVCLEPVSALPPFDLALLNALMGRGVPPAVLNEPAHPESFARQWLDARAAYDIRVEDPAWIFEKLGKLLGDPPGLERLRERSLAAHRIALHPELARERLAHALYRMMHDAPQREVTDGRA